MAAPMVTSRAVTVRGKKGNKKQFPVKNTITSPFQTEWPELQHEDERFILRETQRALAPHAAILAKLPSKGKKQLPLDPEARQKRAALRSQLALGLNEVTRSLERGQLRLALVCRTSQSQPALMTNHLMALSATRNIPVACVQHLSDSLAPILQLKFIMAIGFKKLTDGDLHTFDGLVNSITAITPPIDIPWLQYKELKIKELKKVVTNIIFSTKVEQKTEPKQKGKKGKNKQMKTAEAMAPDHAQMAPDHAQVGTSRDGANTDNTKADSGASTCKSVATVSPPEHGQHEETTHNRSGGQLGQFQRSELAATSEGTASSVQPTDDSSSTSQKRKMSTSPESHPKKKSKTVLKPFYKPVTVIPVKIIPKDMKAGKKQLKKQRKNKKKNKQGGRK